MKIVFNITENKNKATFQQEVVKINTSFNQTENVVKPKFQIGYYPLPYALENYYTKSEANLTFKPITYNPDIDEVLTNGNITSKNVIFNSSNVGFYWQNNITSYGIYLQKANIGINEVETIDFDYRGINSSNSYGNTLVSFGTKTKISNVIIPNESGTIVLDYQLNDFYKKTETYSQSQINTALGLKLDKGGYVGTAQDLYNMFEGNFSILTSNNWDGTRKKLILSNNTNLILNTEKSYGILEVEKDYFNRYTLTINGVLIKLPFANKCLISFVKIANNFNFYVSKFSASAKEIITTPQPIRNKVFTGVSSDVITSSDAKFNLSQFSVGFSVKIQANKFVAVSKGTNTVRNWDVILTNYNTGAIIDLQFNIGTTNLSATVGNSLNTYIDVIATFNGSTCILYRNGVNVGSGSATLTGGGNLMIGQVLNLYSTGEIKDLFIVNRALTPTEVTEYNSSSDKSPLSKSFSSSVVEYFSFGTTVSNTTPAISYQIPSFSVYPKPILMRNSRDWNSGDIANPDLTFDEKKLSGYNYILQYSAYGTTDSDSSPKWRTAFAFSNDFTDPNSWIVDTKFSFEPITGEGYIAANGSIVIKDGWFYHFYQTGNSGDINSTHIRAARSRDLKTWVRLNSGNPIIQRTESYETDGAYDPMVRLNENGLFEMVYCTYKGSQHAIGYATSSDGINWSNKKMVINLNSLGTSEPCICKIGDKYLITCELYIGAVRNIYAGFWDGNTPLIASTMTNIIDGIDAWNSVSCLDSYCFLKDNEIYCFFSGGVTTSNNQGLEAQIGFAKADLIYI